MEREELLRNYRYVPKINSQLAGLREQSEAKKEEYKAVVNKVAEYKGYGAIKSTNEKVEHLYFLLLQTIYF